MPVYTDLLPPTKSAPKAGYRWSPTGPGRGLLIIESPGRMATYAAGEFPCQWDGRAFHLSCVGGQTDPEGAADGYNVFVARGGHGHRCDCRGFSYGRGKPCKHILACVSIWDNGWLDMANPEADTGRP